MSDEALVTLNRSIIDYLEGISNPEKIRLSKRWDKIKDYETYGLSASDYTALYKIFNPSFFVLNLEERFLLSEMWAGTGNSTLIHLGIHLLRLSDRAQELNPSHFSFLDWFIEHFKGWGNTDLFCSAIIQPLLEVYTEETIELLRRWNSSLNPMKRRASVVAFTRKTAESGKYIDFTLEMCNNLIWDTEDLVKKGVGWALKDTLRFDRIRILNYVKDLRRKGVSSTITLYAIRDIKGKERQEILSIKP